MSDSISDLPLTKESRAFGVSAAAARKVEYQQKVGRWSGYKGRSQSTAQHVASAVAVTAPVISELLKQGGVTFDEVLLLKAVAIHDVGEVYHIDEGNSTDTLYQDKSVAHDLKEYRKFLEIYGDFKNPGNKDSLYFFSADQRVFNSLHQAYLLQYALTDISRFPDEATEVMEYLRENKTNSVLIFNLIERIGYIQYAYEQYVYENNVRILVQTLNAQGPHIDKLMKCFFETLKNTVHGVQIYDELWGEKLRDELFSFTEKFGPKYPNPPMSRKVVWFPDQAPAPK